MRFAVERSAAVYCPVTTYRESLTYFGRPWCNYECCAAMVRGVFWANPNGALTSHGRWRSTARLCLNVFLIFLIFGLFNAWGLGAFLPQVRLNASEVAEQAEYARPRPNRQPPCATSGSAHCRGHGVAGTRIQSSSTALSPLAARTSLG